MIMASSDEEAKPIPHSVEELLAAILLLSQETLFCEKELAWRVAFLQQNQPVKTIVSRDAFDCATMQLVREQVLRHRERIPSDTFAFDRRDEIYLRTVLAKALANNLCRGWLRDMVPLSAKRFSEMHNNSNKEARA
jgi:hypothetical protein